VSLAHAAVAKEGGSPAGELILKAAQPWSPSNHSLFDEVSRARAVAVVGPLYKVCWERMKGGGIEAHSFAHLVMKFDVLRIEPPEQAARVAEAAGPGTGSQKALASSRAPWFK